MNSLYEIQKEIFNDYVIKYKEENNIDSDNKINRLDLFYYSNQRYLKEEIKLININENIYFLNRFIDLTYNKLNIEEFNLFTLFERV